MTFWIFAGGISIIALAAMLWPLLRPKAQSVTRSSYDMQIYKDQLKEVEADLARGTLSEAEATASRTEVSRRLLAAADAMEGEGMSGNAPKALSWGIAGVVVVALFGGGYRIYSDIGVPGLQDLPLSARGSARPTQDEAEKALAQISGAESILPNITQIDPKHLDLVAQLKDVLKDRPDDLIGHRMLADNLAQIGQYAEARVAQTNVMRILGDEATADDFSSLAEIMIVAANWYVSPQAETALVDALQRDEKDPRARYYAGILMIQRQEYGRTYQLWSELLTEGPDDAPWIPIIKSQIDAIAAEAGITQPPGPSVEDIAAAQDMSEDDRKDMIRSMVGQLSERLATEGGNAAEWARLIRAYGILGETARASTIWNESKEVFASDPQAIELLLDAARDAEVAFR